MQPSPWQVRNAVRHLRRGGIIAYPTESVWGLGCDPLDEGAVGRLLDLKKRPVEKGLILIAAEFSQLSSFVDIDGEALLRRILATWPGPATWLLPARKDAPRWLRGRHATLAVRVTDHPIAAALCRAFAGPLVSTSANLAGRAPARTALRVRHYFPRAGLLIIPGATQGVAQPSAIFDAASGRRLR